MNNIISSTQNQRVKNTRQLYNKQTRKKEGLFIVEGKKVINDAIKGHIVCSEIFVVDEKADLFPEILSWANNNKVHITYVTEHVLSSICTTKNPQGIAAVFMMKPETKRMIEVDSRLIVILERISDPGNLGTIIRTCDAVGADAIVMSNCVDIYNEKVIRASMGSVFNIIIKSIDDTASYVRQLVLNNWQVGCGHLNGDDFFSREQKRKVALVIGNEANGVTEETANECTSLWKLPMKGGAESLNAAIAAGIMLYDISNKITEV